MTAPRDRRRVGSEPDRSEAEPDRSQAEPDRSGGASGDKARLFVALDLPNHVREALAAWQRRELGALPELRTVAPEALHLTLCFLGWRELEEVGRICELVAGAAGAVRDIALGEASWLPRRAPRVLAVEVQDPSGTCATLQSAVADVLIAGGFYKRETRPFVAHVTVGRVRGGRAPRGLRSGVPAPPPPLRFEGASVTLYRSRPTARGATYEGLVRAELT